MIPVVMMLRIGRVLLLVAGQLALAAATILVIDAACYQFLPTSVAWYFPGYRPTQSSEPNDTGPKYPPGYFVRDGDRGFDIGPGVRTEHYISEENIKYAVWSNRLGCFDREWNRAPLNYYYFAGDSFTWGFSPYESKFATVFEKLTNIDSLKCGVTNTGQRHQFSKFLGITRALGTFPARVIIGYYSNDVANDFAYPLTTVINGQPVNNAFVDANFNVVRLDNRRLESLLTRKQDEREEAKAQKIRINRLLTKYSITSHLVKKLSRSLRPRPTLVMDGRKLFAVEHVEATQTRGGRFEYANTKFALSNKNIFMKWKAHSMAHGYELIVMLIPPRIHALSRDFYAELKAFLEQESITYVDLASEFRARGIKVEDIYWPSNDHFSPSGNELVGQILRAELRD